MEDFDVGKQIGQLAGAVDEMSKRLDKNDKDHESILMELKSLNTWKWKTAGGIGALLFILNMLFLVVRDKISKFF